MDQIAATFDPLRQTIELGGPVVAILAVVSVIALAVIIVKLVQFTLARIGRTARAEQALDLLHAGRRDEALAHASEGRSGAAEAIAMVIRRSQDNRYDKAAVEEEIGRFALSHLHKHQSGLRFLDAVVQLSPLLGLFGTVLGMIEAFRALQGAGNAVDPSILAGGIWVALLTTAVGLAVAMPVSVVLTYLESRLENERVAIETLATDALAPSPRQMRPASSEEQARVQGRQPVAAHAH